MGSLLIRCPGCGASLSSAAALAPGKLVDCPRCRLLFAPTAEDVRAPRGRADTSPRPPSRSPWDDRRRRRRLSVGEKTGLAVVCVVMVGLAGVVLITYFFYLRGQSPQVGPAAPTTPAEPTPWVAAPPASPAPDAEVEDDSSARPRRSVPSLDDDPTITPDPPPASAPRPSAPLAKRLVGSWEPAGDNPPSRGGPQPFVFEFRDDGGFALGALLGAESVTVSGKWKAVSEEGDTLRVSLSDRIELTPGQGGSEIVVRFLDEDRLRFELAGGAQSGTWRRQRRDP
jgi:hypothetical protein